jgi:hypothetical protein
LALGGLLICAALFALAALAIACRSPNPPRWAIGSWAGELGSLAIVALLAFGVADFTAGAVSVYEDGLHVLDLGLLAVLLFGVLAIWRRLDVRARLKAVAADARAQTASPSGAEARSAGHVITTKAPALATEPPPPPQPRPRAA